SSPSENLSHSGASVKPEVGKPTAPPEKAAPAPTQIAKLVAVEETTSIQTIAQNISSAIGPEAAAKKLEGKIQKAAGAAAMGRNGILRDGVMVNVAIGGRTFLVRGRNGVSVKTALLEMMEAAGVEIASPAFGGLAMTGKTIPYEVPVTIFPDEDRVDIETTASVTIDAVSGKVIGTECEQKVYPNKNAIYMHSHPDSAKSDEEWKLKSAEDQKNLDNGLFDNAQHIYVIESNGTVRTLDRDMTKAAALAPVGVKAPPAAQYAVATNIFAFTIKPDGTFSETISRKETASKPAEQLPTPERIQPLAVVPLYILTALMRSALSPQNKIQASNTKAGLASIGTLPMDVNTESRARAIAQRIRDMKDRGLMEGVLVTAPHIDTITDERGNLIRGAGFETICRMAQANSDLWRVAILVEDKAGADTARSHFAKANISEGKVAIINISEKVRDGRTITDHVARYFEEAGVTVRSNNIGLGIMNSQFNRDRIAKEIIAKGKESA
ncbi:MAG: hypothetical protein Q7N50_13820, partial [Armatimonadota bacterium]|nr:hypothetical protein [Armatimonadota bacterium]